MSLIKFESAKSTRCPCARDTADEDCFCFVHWNGSQIRYTLNLENSKFLQSKRFSGLETLPITLPEQIFQLKLSLAENNLNNQQASSLKKNRPESSWPLILVTGASGYIGSHVVFELLKQAKYGIVALDSLTNSSLECLRRVRELAKGGSSGEGDDEIPPLYFHHTDIRERAQLEGVFDLYKTQSQGEKSTRQTRIKHVIHFAALKSVNGSRSNPKSYYSTNVLGTANLLDVMNQSGVRSIVFSSSAVVYGNRSHSPGEHQSPSSFKDCLLSESACLVHAHQTEVEAKRNYERITNPYGQTKLMCEELIHKLCDRKLKSPRSETGSSAKSGSNFRAVILRYTNPSGNHPSGIIGDSPVEAENLMPIAAQVLQGKRESITVYGNDYPTRDGTGIRDFIHVQDLAKGHLAAIHELQRKGKTCNIYPNNCKTYNLGTGRGASVMEVLKALMEVSGKTIEVKVGPRRLGDLPVVVCDPSKAERELGWRSEKNVKDMARDLWNFCLKNPNGLIDKS